MSQRNVVRWGIIGCGDVTEVKSGPAFQKVAGSKLVAVMRRDAAKAEDYARRHAVPRWTTDAAALINAPDIDALYIATPPGAHEQYALQVAAAGKPCYVEKPMARTALEGRRMLDAFSQGDVPLFVAYYRRALPRFLKIAELLEDLGPLRSVSYRYADPQMRDAPADGAVPWRLLAEHAGGGLFLDLGSHALDLLDFWLGPLQNVRGLARRVRGKYAVEDYVEMEFTAAGVPGRAQWDFTSQVREDAFEITAEKGAVAVPCFADGPVELVWETGRREEFAIPHPPHVHQPLVEQVVATLLGRGSCASTGESALRTQEVMDTVLASFYGGRDNGFWRRPRA
ncbi:MAG TPA: Gfo/Idh/MocA family oxidoreductase [Phycisphaerae bacterium]|nr:Gfo/Idh/MocA family oxidoreductase [Phycisphaerae bacterium]